MTIEQSLQEFLLAGRADGLRPATLTWYERIIGALALHFAGCEVSAITRHQMREYVAGLHERKAYANAPQKPAQEGNLARDSVASYVTALHRFWTWVAQEQNIPNPMQGIKRVKRRKPQPKAIDGKDFVALFNATADSTAGIRDRALLAFFADTGCRLGGALSLTLDRLHVIERKAYVWEKGDKSRAVFFTHYTAQLLQQWLGVRKSPAPHVFISMESGQVFSMSGIHEILKRLKKRAKVTGRVNPHSFRHRFAREFIQRGGDISTLAKLLGHESINTTALYYAVFDERELQQMHDKHSPMSGGGAAHEDA